LEEIKMQEKMRTIGYLCPSCRKKVIRDRSAFALAASGAVVSCACEQSSLTIDAGEQRFRLSVPCGVCGGEHSAEIDATQLLEGKGIGLACPQTGLLCCFIGEAYEVERELDRLSLAAEKEQETDSELFVDSVIMHEVLSELHEIASRPHGISCACGSEKYSMKVRPTCVDLICSDCGARLRIDAATDEDLDRLCCHWTLKLGGAG
jgi:transcription elongation factor Elf1